MPKIHIDVRLVELDAELDALRRFRDFVEPQILALQKREHERAEADLRITGPGEDGEYLQVAWQERDFVAEHVVPRFFRNPFLVAAWAVYENAVGTVAEFVAHGASRPITLDDIRGDFVARSRKYFDHVLMFSLDEDGSRLARIGELYWLRNFFAHRNGRAYRLPKGYRQQLDSLLKRHSSLKMDELDCLIVSKEFLASAVDDLAGSAWDLVNRARGGPSVRIDPPGV